MGTRLEYGQAAKYKVLKKKKFKTEDGQAFLISITTGGRGFSNLASFMKSHNTILHS